MENNTVDRIPPNVYFSQQIGSQPISYDVEFTTATYTFEEPLEDDVSSEDLLWLIETHPIIYDEFIKQQKEQLSLFATKHRKYGSVNLTGGLTQFESLFGLFFRMNDKLNRYKNIIQTESETADETLEDTLNDLSNYANIARIILKKKW